MCDTEHMLDCLNETGREDEREDMKITSSDLDKIVERFQVKNIYINRYIICIFIYYNIIYMYILYSCIQFKFLIK